MTGQQPGPRIVPPDEVAQLVHAWEHDNLAVTMPTVLDLANTAAVLGEQRDAVLALHKPRVSRSEQWCPVCMYTGYPCPTARALGVTDEG